MDLIHKGKWFLIPANLVLHEPNLRLSPLGVVIGDPEPFTTIPSFL
jgi:hypothetical protein